MSAVISLLRKALEWGPTVLKLIAYLLTILGGGQTGGIVSGAYGSTPSNWFWNLLTYGGAGVFYVLSGLLPKALPTIEKWLDVVLAEAKKRINIDPKNETDVDERFFDILGEFVLTALALLLKRWTTDPDEAADVIAELRARKAIAESGVPAAKMRAALTELASSPKGA